MHRQNHRAPNQHQSPKAPAAPPTPPRLHAPIGRVDPPATAPPLPAAKQIRPLTRHEADLEQQLDAFLRRTDPPRLASAQDIKRAYETGMAMARQDDDLTKRMADMVQRLLMEEEKALRRILVDTCTASNTPSPTVEQIRDRLNAMAEELKERPTPRAVVFLVSSSPALRPGATYQLPEGFGWPGLPCDQTVIMTAADARKVHTEIPLVLTRKLSPTLAEYRGANPWDANRPLTTFPPFESPETPSQSANPT